MLGVNQPKPGAKCEVLDAEVPADGAAQSRAQLDAQAAVMHQKVLNSASLINRMQAGN
ncbi:MAG: hypothetical protein AAB558_03225 [Patescibacteria group bacterium]